MKKTSIIVGASLLLLAAFWFPIHFLENNNTIEAMQQLKMRYVESGRSQEVKQSILDFWANNDSAFATNSAYLLEKYEMLIHFGDLESAQEVFSKVPDEDLESPLHLFNRLQDRIETDKDSSLALIRKFEASDDKRWLEYWIHDSFAQWFTFRGKKMSNFEDNYELLKSLQDLSYPNITRITSGLLAWVNAQTVADDPEAVAELAAQPFGGEGSREERYRLLLFDVLNQHPSYRVEAEALLEPTLTRLQTKISELDSSKEKRTFLEIRARTRYYLAHAYFLKGKIRLENAETDSATKWFKLASDFSSDQKDRRVTHAYFYEIHLLQGQPDYRGNYASHLRSIGKLQAALDTLIPSAIVDPSQISTVKAMFNELFPGKLFENYWTKKLNELLPIAPSFRLKTLDGKLISLDSFRGKWVLLDFWGTWCLPCVVEMPKLQQLYKTLPQNSEMITIACRDNSAAVTSFLKQKNYTFPVVMADDKVEKQYNVSGYPFKVLVTPTGRYLEIPFSDDWESKVRIYLFMEI